MSKFPFASVIIVNYNGRAFIKECIDSVLKSNYPHFEIIIIDNASTDGSAKFIKELFINKLKKKKSQLVNPSVRNEPIIKLVESKKNLYFTGGSNLGAQKAKGKKLIFLNSDTVVDKNWLKELVAISKNHPRYLIQPKILFYKNKKTIDNVGGKYTFFGFGYGIGRGKIDCGQYDKNYPIDYANGTCFLINKKFFKKLNGFDERFHYFYEDVDLALRAKKLGGQSWYCYKSVIYHKGSLSFKKNVSKIKKAYYFQKNRLLTLLKNL